MPTKRYTRNDLPIKRPQKIVVGFDFKSEKFKHTNPDGSAVDLSGYTIEAVLTLADGTTQALTVNRDDLNGTYTLSLEDSVTAGYAEQIARFAVSVEDTLGDKLPYFHGPVPIEVV